MRVENIVAGFLVWGTILGVLLFGFYTVTDTACKTYDAEKLSVVEVDDLIGEGYYGDPLDRAERLYSEGCR